MLGWETKDGGYVRGLRLHGVGVEDATEMEARYLSVSARLCTYILRIQQKKSAGEVRRLRLPGSNASCHIHAVCPSESLLTVDHKLTVVC